MTVPALADLAGLWRRAWLRAPGVEDATTRVFWRQGAAVYVDLRIPADLPDLSGARSLAELDSAAILSLARCEGFAGTAAVAQGVCTWTRAVNWRGPETGADVGRLAMTPEGLHEAGLLADYEELWTRAEDGPVMTRALTDGENRLGFLAWTATGFSLGWGNPRAKAGPPLADRLAAAIRGRDRAALAAALDGEVSLGLFEAGRARIVLSTNPLRVGVDPFPEGDPAAAALPIADHDVAGRPRTRRWVDAAPPATAPA